MTRERGAASVQMLVILVPVLFGLMGFAIDLGQLYMSRGEVQAAANAMALAAAEQLIGTDLATESANTQARLTLNNATGLGNKYYFGGYPIGETNGTLTSEAPDPAYFATVSTAMTGDTTATVGGIQARHARVTLSAEVPLTFWSFLPLVTDRKVALTASAAAGMSMPLCTACGIEPIAVAPVNSGDTLDFGFIPLTNYTLGYQCNGAPTPQTLPNTTARIPYLLLNRLDSGAIIYADEISQLFRAGADGLPGSTVRTQACFTVNSVEQRWVSAAPVACTSANPGTAVTAMMCGITTRFETTYPASCAGVPEIETLSTVYPADTDVTEIADYAQYLGNGRRVITVVVVDALNPGGDMVVLGYRQFLVQPAQGGVDINPTDRNGRFAALYLGSVKPLKQGSFAGCEQAAGPGKVVLHQ